MSPVSNGGDTVPGCVDCKGGSTCRRLQPPVSNGWDTFPGCVLTVKEGAHVGICSRLLVMEGTHFLVVC